MNYTHYQSQLKVNKMEIKEKLKNIIDTNDVCLFMKGVPEAPQCGFSMAISNILKHLNVKFEGINVLEDESIRNGIKEYSDWPTIPQLYIKQEFVGGCDIVKEMFEKGELKTLLENKKII
jgi:monothiol glutaredoxin